MKDRGLQAASSDHSNTVTSHDKSFEIPRSESLRNGRVPSRLNPPASGDFPTEMHLNDFVQTPRPLALVTGASSGMGADLARELARDGYDLVLVARREALLQTLAAELATHGAHSAVVAANLGVCLAASRLNAELVRLGLGEPDVLINAAGFGDYADFLQAEPTKLTEMLHLNVVALTELTRAFLPGMIARGRGRGSAGQRALRLRARSWHGCLQRHQGLRAQPGGGADQRTSAHRGHADYLVPRPDFKRLLRSGRMCGHGFVRPSVLEHDGIGRGGASGVLGDEKGPPDRGAGLGQQTPSVFSSLRAMTGSVLKCTAADLRFGLSGLQALDFLPVGAILR